MENLVGTTATLISKKKKYITLIRLPLPRFDVHDVLVLQAVFTKSAVFGWSSEIWIDLFHLQ